LPSNPQDVESFSAQRAVEGMLDVQHTIIKHRSSFYTNETVCQRTVAVCVMGQLSRLETKSKIENLFQSELNIFHRTDVFVVMEVGQDFYGNTGTIHNSDAVCHEDYREPAEVEAMFSPFYRAGLFIKPSAPQVEPVVENWPNITRDKQKKDLYRELRAHFNRWTHLAQCGDLIHEQEKLLGCPYTAVAKIRDNGIVTKPMGLAVRGDRVEVKACASWGGVNDKFFKAARRWSAELFNGPLEMALKVNKGIRWAQDLVRPGRNDETFLKDVLDYYHVPITKVQNNGRITVVDGRCAGVDGGDGAHREWCLVQAWKDCRPPGKIPYKGCR